MCFAAGQRVIAVDPQGVRWLPAKITRVHGPDSGKYDLRFEGDPGTAIESIGTPDLTCFSTQECHNLTRNFIPGVSDELIRPLRVGTKVDTLDGRETKIAKSLGFVDGKSRCDFNPEWSQLNQELHPRFMEVPPGYRGCRSPGSGHNLAASFIPHMTQLNPDSTPIAGAVRRVLLEDRRDHEGSAHREV